MAEASERERDYLSVLARLLGGSQPVRGAEVAAGLGVTARQLSTVRDRLLKQGTVTAEGEYLQFAIPRMTDYLRRETSTPER